MDFVDFDLRKVRYFVAVADLLHFGQAASALHIAQPVLSRQIRSLEQDIGLELLVRNRRSVALTAASVLDDARGCWPPRRRPATACTGRRAGRPTSPWASGGA
ncbi:LysR family transcriptional regulator [Streptomyces sp. S1D4-11]